MRYSRTCSHATGCIGSRGGGSGGKKLGLPEMCSLLVKRKRDWIQVSESCMRFTVKQVVKSQLLSTERFSSGVIESLGELL
jgi:hypothetical protein